jgi:hypothetical protein
MIEERRSALGACPIRAKLKRACSLLHSRQARNPMCSNPFCLSPAWWLWRSVHTRSHPELGRKSLQRQWYFVSRRGRVGRRQACKRQKNHRPRTCSGEQSLQSQYQTHQKPAQAEMLGRGFVFWNDSISAVIASPAPPSGTILPRLAYSA